MKPVLYYVHDPMCSWCWGFRPVLEQIKQALAGKVDFQYILGGLAPDTGRMMPEHMQHTIIETWRRIQSDIPGTEFNFDFWSRCKPRRSTYPSCRAVIACRMQQPVLAEAMVNSIQQAYYLNARNPSDDEVLIQLAKETGLNVKTFIRDFESDACRNLLESELLLARDLYVSSFPTLVLSRGVVNATIQIDYNNSDNILQQIFQKLNAFS